MPQELTRPNGDIVWSATYDAMGRVDKILVNDVDQPLRMQGQYWDEEIDLCYNRYRYFDPQICSFISQDPLGLAAGENVYAYAPNVWNWVDPLGLRCRQARQYNTFEEVKLKRDQYFLSDAVQFRIANKQFVQRMDIDPAFRKGVLKKSPELLEWVKDSSKHSNSPPGFTWHHDETEGILKLVHRGDHATNQSIYHPTGSGGRDIWGGGKLGRKGKLNPDGTKKG